MKLGLQLPHTLPRYVIIQKLVYFNVNRKNKWYIVIIISKISLFIARNAFDLLKRDRGVVETGSIYLTEPFSF